MSVSAGIPTGPSVPDWDVPETYLERLEDLEAGVVYKALPDLGQLIHRRTFGVRDDAVALAIIANRDTGGLTPTVEVDGVAEPSLTGGRSSVALYIDNKARLPDVDSTSTTFTATTVTFGGAVDLSAVLPGMTVDIAPPIGGSTSIKVGVVASVAGQVVTLVEQWKQNGSTVAAPANGTQAVINRVTKAWATNFSVYKTATLGNLDASAAVLEADLFVSSDDSQATLDASAVHSWGVDSVMLGLGKATALFTARGSLKAQFGYVSTGIDGGGDGGEFSAHYAATQGFGQTGGVTQGAFMDDESNADVAFRANRATRTAKMLGGFTAHGDTTLRVFSATVEGTLEWSNTAVSTPDTKLTNEVVTGTATGNLHVATGGFKVGTSAPIRLSSGGAIEMTERADTGAASADKAFLYCRDNGSGKTQFVAQFPTGAVQVIATQP